MSNEAPQSYANHVRKLPRLYVAIGVVLAANVLWSVAVVVRFPRMLNYEWVIVSLALFGLVWPIREFALVVQNRVIRLEERLRLARLLPDDLRARIDELSVDQLVALRFASDGELSELTRQVLTENLTEKDAIKKRIKNWRPDHLRV